jgi:hypothetical protein
MTEKTFRKDAKWAKVSGQRGCWHCAKGWRGQFKATYLQTYPTKDGAVIAAHHWVSDQ